MIKSTNLKGKVAIVTGATSQLGRLFSKALAANGALVYITDLDKKKCDLLREELNSETNAEHESHVMDVTSEPDVMNICELILKKNGRLDILVNSAGIAIFSDYGERTKEEFMQVCEVNTYGTFNCIQKFSKLMISTNTPGSIINIASIYGCISGDPRIYTDTKRNTSEVYAATKASIIQMTKYFAAHLGGQKIRVNSISPGGVYNKQGEDFMKNYSNKVPLARMANGDEIAGSVIFLSDNKFSSYITGHNLLVDGGFTSW